MIRLDARAGLSEVFLIAAFLIFVSMVIRQTFTVAPCILLSAAAALFTASATARLSAEASNRTHTVSVLLHIRTSQTLRGLVETVGNEYGKRNVPKSHLTNSEKRDAVRAASEILNFYEFIAKAIENGDVDETLLRESIERQFVQACDKFMVIIEEGISTDERNPPKTYSGILKLYEEWSGKPLLKNT